jgi:hypothetical protein
VSIKVHQPSFGTSWIGSKPAEVEVVRVALKTRSDRIAILEGTHDGSLQIVHRSVRMLIPLSNRKNSKALSQIAMSKPYTIDKFEADPHQQLDKEIAE